MATSLFRRHSAALIATYEGLERRALTQGEAQVGTPGSLARRKNAAGLPFLVRQYYDAAGRKRDQYLGTAADSEALVGEWTQRIGEARDVLAAVRLLAREGYAALSPTLFAALAASARHGIFKSGALLVGTHAFEAIANRMGIRAVRFASEDVEIARTGKIELPRSAVIDLVDVPTLAYLATEAQDGAVISTHGVAAVRVPSPERFAWHKLIAAQLRAARSPKIAKDQQQAAVLIAALGELRPGALAAAYERIPVAMRKHVRTGLRQVESRLACHSRAWAEVSGVARP